MTLFAYGVTGTGKTHTMRGGKTLADRGMIPRLLSSIYRKSKALEKNSNGETTVAVSMSYYEIYNDRVFDLFETPEKRTLTGLPIREAEGGKTVVVGLTESPCGTLKEFESLYDRANANRSTGATKLNALSSRSHAILCVKVTISSPTETRVSTASAIDLAGSEDNRRTGNSKDRMVESASINKSLFVLAQCVEAISKKQQRIPYRESKMTRILSLGQNNGFTIMILNLAPVRSYHLDTLSSLNFANRTKRIEVREVENEPMFKGPPRQPLGASSMLGPNTQRQPLRPLTNGVNINLAVNKEDKKDKPAKLFSVYSDRSKTTTTHKTTGNAQKSSPLKRPADVTHMASARPNKTARPTPSFIRHAPESTNITKASIETLVEKKVSEILAARALEAPVPAPVKDVSDEVQKRLDSIERRLEGQEGERAEGLSFLLMAKQHQARGENGSALKMYELARPYFPDNEKLVRKIESLRNKIQERQVEDNPPVEEDAKEAADASYHHDKDDVEYSEDEVSHRPKARKAPKSRKARTSSPDPLVDGEVSPRTQRLLDIINSRDALQIRTLNGLGSKKAEGIVEYLTELDEGQAPMTLTSWRELNMIKGIGKKTLEAMRDGVMV